MIRNGGDDELDEAIDSVLEDAADAPMCTWSADDDEQCRAFIFSQLANAEIDGKALVTNMELVFQWMRHGKVPGSSTDVRILPRPFS
jgi:hypothetical protein